MIRDKFAQELMWAAENVGNHTVELICGKGSNEIWRCTNNGSSCYGFDLVISRFGIAMYGDVDSLVFSVGAQYGIEFLARDSVCSYMISKLEPEYRNKRTLDEDALRQVLATAGLELIINKFVPYTLDDEDYELPEWAVYGSTNVSLEVVLEFMANHEVEQPHMKFEDFREQAEFLLEERAPNGLADVEAYLGENYSTLNLGPEWYEHTISKYDGTLIQRLEMLRLCALKIKEVKNAGDSSEEQSH